MANSEKVIGFRFDEDVLKKLDCLMEDDERKAKMTGVVPRKRREIIEEAIRDRYFRMINESQDADIVERISDMISDQVESAMGVIQKRIDEILYLAIKNDLGNRIFYRSPSVLPAPKDKEQAIRVIIGETSMWDLALEEYLMDRWTREKTLMHIRQEEK